MILKLPRFVTESQKSKGLPGLTYSLVQHVQEFQRVFLGFLVLLLLFEKVLMVFEHFVYVHAKHARRLMLNWDFSIFCC
jgi:hypothetical protein